MYRCRISIFFSVLLLLELAAFNEKSESASSTEEVFFNFKTKISFFKKDKRIPIIFPGTRWCGNGDIAESDHDLGHFMETDTCCRAHDHCHDVIHSGESKHGLFNGGYFSRVDCSCDEIFYDCLSSLCSPLAASIGLTYFDILRPHCFTFDHPTKCYQEEGESPQEICDLDTDTPKIWQWREQKKFNVHVTSKKLYECFENATSEKLKITKENLSHFVHKHGIDPLVEMCKELPFDSWYKKLLCPKIALFS